MMKTKSCRRILGFAFAMVLILSCVGPASAVVSPPVDTDAAKAYLFGSVTYPGGVYAVLDPDADLMVRINVPDTEIRHVVGTGLSISVPEIQTYSVPISGNLNCNGAAQLGAETAAAAQDAFKNILQPEVGLTELEVHTLKPNVDYTLAPEEDAGLYCLAVFFPGKEVVKQVTGTDQITSILWQETVDYVPLAGESYAKIAPYEE